MNSQSKLPCIEHVVYIKVSPEKVYKTLTTGEGWDSWFTQGTTVNPRPGGSIQLRWKNFGAGHWTTEDGGAVLEAETNCKFVFQWSPGENPTTVVITLKQLGEGTLLKLVESGYSPSDTDFQACLGCAIGWGEALTLLKFYLEYGVTYGEVPYEDGIASPPLPEKLELT
ncbi:SRPBCC family protein [Microseira wollei]|uniref:Activator of Hsp90 ATPase homologue 1/2-like C-terminal domain-containing protein n=1 Tax=Microseira wollei NIES-4236 TaxID=2530354 RepID=A0AAV3XMG1_9CYAN|nr:SRPBCC domain-containing protein [Microseira wollei]GET41981.1 hypothetical protein MiSe_67950 [Microseira wollei NIES-4236]